MQVPDNQGIQWFRYAGMEGVLKGCLTQHCHLLLRIGVATSCITEDALTGG